MPVGVNTRAVHTTSDEHGMDEVEAALVSTETGLSSPISSTDTQCDTPQRHGRACGEPERFDARSVFRRACDVRPADAYRGHGTTHDAEHRSLREHVPVAWRVRARMSIWASGPLCGSGQTLAELDVGPPRTVAASSGRHPGLSGW